MCAVDHCLTSHDIFQFTHDSLLCIRIQVARCLIEEEYLCLGLKEPTGDENTLTLASRKFGAKITDLGLISVLHAHDTVVNAALTRYSLQVLLCGLRITIS